jgi:hypothetical protein
MIVGNPARQKSVGAPLKSRRSPQSTSRWYVKPESQPERKAASVRAASHDFER